MAKKYYDEDLEEEYKEKLKKQRNKSDDVLFAGAKSMASSIL